MIHKLDTLIQEVVDFGNIISYASDPTDINFQNACNLFNEYLSWKLDELKEELKMRASELEIQCAIQELAILCNSIKQAEQPAADQTYWFTNLFQYCTNIQQNRIAAI